MLCGLAREFIDGQEQVVDLTQAGRHRPGVGVEVLPRLLVAFLVLIPVVEGDRRASSVRSDDAANGFRLGVYRLGRGTEPRSVEFVADFPEVDFVPQSFDRVVGQVAEGADIRRRPRRSVQDLRHDVGVRMQSLHGPAVFVHADVGLDDDPYGQLAGTRLYNGQSSVQIFDRSEGDSPERRGNPRRLCGLSDACFRSGVGRWSGSAGEPHAQGGGQGKCEKRGAQAFSLMCHTPIVHYMRTNV